MHIQWALTLPMLENTGKEEQDMSPYAHNGHSQFSDSNTGEFDGTALHNGLSDLGKEVVSLLNYYGCYD